VTGKDAIASSTIVETNLVDATTSGYLSTGTDKGFYITFATGEKSVNAPLSIRGSTFFGTNKPTPPSLNSCSSNLGQAKGYQLDPFKGFFDSTVFDGGGLPPSPTRGVVTIMTADGPVKKDFCVGCGGAGGGGTNDPDDDDDDDDGSDCTSGLGSSSMGSNSCLNGLLVPKNPRRTYWYKK